MQSTVYKERQFFRNPIVLMLLLGIVAMSIWAMVQQIFLGKPFGNNPAPDSFVILFSILLLIFFSFFLFIHQDTEINNVCIIIRMRPFGGKKIYWKDIEKCYVRKYNPLLEYGGWGIRYGFGGKGMAYNLGGGNHGFQLELTNGQKVLIGTKKQIELESAIKDSYLSKYLQEPKN